MVVVAAGEAGRSRSSHTCSPQKCLVWQGQDVAKLLQKPCQLHAEANRSFTENFSRSLQKSEKKIDIFCLLEESQKFIYNL